MSDKAAEGINEGITALMNARLDAQEQGDEFTVARLTVVVETLRRLQAHRDVRPGGVKVIG